MVKKNDKMQHPFKEHLGLTSEPCNWQKISINAHIAGRIIEHYTDRIKEKYINEYYRPPFAASSNIFGGWKCLPLEPIVFYEDGELADGFKRLKILSTENAEVTKEFYVAFGASVEDVIISRGLNPKYASSMDAVMPLFGLMFEKSTLKTVHELTSKYDVTRTVDSILESKRIRVGDRMLSQLANAAHHSDGSGAPRSDISCFDFKGICQYYEPVCKIIDELVYDENSYRSNFYGCFRYICDGYKVILSYVLWISSNDDPNEDVIKALLTDCFIKSPDDISNEYIKEINEYINSAFDYYGIETRQRDLVCILSLLKLSDSKFNLNPL